MAKTIRIECKGADLLPLDIIEDFQGNLKKRGKKEIDAIITSIEKYGFSFPFFVWNGDGHNRCLDGHGRIQALAEMRRRGVSLPLFPVAYIDAKDEDEAKQKLLRLNSQYGAMSIDSVMEFAEGLDVAWDELALPSGTLEFGEGAGGEAAPTEGDDEVPEVVEPTTQLGDLYELGAHRLLCGDSTKTDDVARLMDGQTAALFATDPPYGVAYGDETGSGSKFKVIANDENNGPKLQKFLEDTFRAWTPFLKKNAAWYLWHAQMTQGFFAAAAAAADILIHRQIVWVKPSLVMGHGDFHWKHELCFYGWQTGNRPDWHGDRKQTTVWEMGRENDHIHPTQKPIEAFIRPMTLNTKEGEICAEPFSGSGTQFVSAEKVGRICYGMEIDPHYCDVIVARYRKWCADNGREAIVKRNGEAFDGESSEPKTAA